MGVHLRCVRGVSPHDFSINYKWKRDKYERERERMYEKNERVKKKKESERK